MNKIWTYMMIASIVALTFIDPTSIVKEMSDASWGVLKLCAELLAIYAIWMGLLEIVDKSGLGEKLANLLSPIIKWLFKIQDKEATKYIALNISSNMMGLGNAATPMGIKAMQRLDDGSGTVTPAMIMLLIVNSTAIQLLPTTTIGLRATSGSQNPTDIIIPTLVATLITCVFGIVCAKLFEKIHSNKKDKNQNNYDNNSRMKKKSKNNSNLKKNSSDIDNSKSLKKTFQKQTKNIICLDLIKCSRNNNINHNLTDANFNCVKKEIFNNREDL